MRLHQLQSRTFLLVGSNVSLGASQSGYGERIDEYNEENGGWNQ